jgi:hypothetical protein
MQYYNSGAYYSSTNHYLLPIDLIIIFKKMQVLFKKRREMFGLFLTSNMKAGTH